MGCINFLYTIPSISMLGFLIPFSGVGNTTAIMALIIYALLPMVRNTYTGLTNIDAGILEAAKGMGSTRMQILIKIKLPLALPVIMSGIRSMVTMTIALGGNCFFYRRRRSWSCNLSRNYYKSEIYDYGGKFFNCTFGDCNGLDAVIAGTYFELLCASRGLGAVMMTYPLDALRLMPEVMELLEIPKDHMIPLILGFGYPEISYKRGVQKKLILPEFIGFPKNF